MDNNIIDKRTKGFYEIDGSATRIFIDCNYTGQDTYQICEIGDNTDTNKANAAFIVKACNEYDKLVSQRELLLEALKEIIENYYNVDEYSNNLLLKAEEAIKKCEPLT